MKNKRFKELNKLVNRKTTEVQQHVGMFRVYDKVNNRKVTEWSEYYLIKRYLETGSFIQLERI